MSILDALKKKDSKKISAKSSPRKVKDDKKKKPASKAVAKKDKKPQTKKKNVARVASGAYRVLVRPLISEKATFLSGENKYVFEVTTNSTKKEVAQAVKDVYGVNPVKVNIISVLGKERRYGRVSGRTKNRKKAVVTLPAGESLQLYEGV